MRYFLAVLSAHLWPVVGTLIPVCLAGIWQVYRQRRALTCKEEILHLLREGKWAGKHGFTGSGRSLVYEGEMMDVSPRLRRLGEYRLHQLLKVMQAEGTVDQSQLESNCWFARY